MSISGIDSAATPTEEREEEETQEVTEQEEEEEARFFPPLWQQRRNLARRIIDEHHATSVIDFGCGEGALLSFLVWESTNEWPITRLAGVDMDGERLELATDTCQPQEFELGPNLRVNKLSIDIFQGSVAEADQRMVGYDALACLEVVEHLDPDVLEKFWGVVLGTLRPKLVIVSTPNAEFNVCFAQLKYGTPEAIFRNDDHRFEWTRQEFQDWCKPAAEKYEYTISFSGVGRLANSDPSIGHCTQFAILERRSPPPLPASGDTSLVPATECYTLLSRVKYPIYAALHSEEEILAFLHEKIALTRPRPPRAASEESDNYNYSWENGKDQVKIDGEGGGEDAKQQNEVQKGANTQSDPYQELEIELGVLSLDNLWLSLDVRQRCKTRSEMIRILEKSSLVRVNVEQDKICFDEEDVFWEEWDKEYEKRFEVDVSSDGQYSDHDEDLYEYGHGYEEEEYQHGHCDNGLHNMKPLGDRDDQQSPRTSDWKDGVMASWGATGWPERSGEGPAMDDSYDPDSPWNIPVQTPKDTWEL
ncbi:hypothetical protein EDD21DRAFT_363058 [Dissophora ornata]|nr:Small RNA 2'-O-methyltransferase [Dissophora ornata]KAI8605673.1 hypothetical protein EDD21DRAFT_363058 [Dissophora ornata]